MCLLKKTLFKIGKSGNIFSFYQYIIRKGKYKYVQCLPCQYGSCIGVVRDIKGMSLDRLFFYIISCLYKKYCGAHKFQHGDLIQFFLKL